MSLPYKLPFTFGLASPPERVAQVIANIRNAQVLANVRVFQPPQPASRACQVPANNRRSQVLVNSRVFQVINAE